MKNIWSAIFTKAVVDSATNSLSLLDCVDEITVNFSNAEDLSRPKKSIPISLAIISLWINEDVSKKIKFEYVIEIIDPQNKTIGEFSNTAVFENGKKRLRTMTQTNGMDLTSEGEYMITVKYKAGDGEFITVSKIPLDIKFVLTAQIKKAADR
jgi:hypothetical protein